MMLFVTSLRSRANATDYANVELLLQGALDSIENQSSGEHVTIVVGNEDPSFELPPNVHFVKVGFPAPTRSTGPHAELSEFVRDKGSKLGIGLIAGRQFAPSHVMIFDSDDFIHRDLVRLVHAHPDAPGWVVEHGWVFSRRRNGYRRQDDFNRTCGTCFVLPYDVYDVPAHLDEHASQDDVVDAFGERLTRIIGAHRDAIFWYTEHGHALRTVPFRAVAYHVDTGENHSGKVLPGAIRPWDARLGRDFAIRSQAPRLRTLLSCYGPRALAQTARARARRARTWVAGLARRTPSGAGGSG